MQKAVLIARILLGLVFVVFSANYVLEFIDPGPNEAAGAFMGALAATGYMFPVIKLVEFIVGVCLLVGRYVPFALTILAPITINIVLLHIFLDTAGLPIAIVILVLHVYLAWAYKSSFKGVCDMNAQPG